MIKAAFFLRGGQYRRVEVSGHAGYAPAGEDIVCAAVTSALQLCCNGITEVLGIPARVGEGENLITLELGEGQEGAQPFLQALRLHMELLAEQYEKYVKLTVSEV